MPKRGPFHERFDGRRDERPCPAPNRHREGRHPGQAGEGGGHAEGVQLGHRDLSALVYEPGRSCPAGHAGRSGRLSGRPSRPGHPAIDYEPRVAAIRYAHKLAGYEVPTDDERVRSVVRGHRRVASTAPTRKAPATAERIIAMALVPGAGVKAIRDRALLLLGFAGAFRRSELVALDIDDLHETDAGLRVNIRRSKTDQEAEGATIAILKGSLACPVVAVKNWLEAAKITSGPVFRRVRKGGAIGDRLTDQSVADIVKAQAERVGLDPTLFAGHSLRAGFLTSAAAKGASIFKMMDVSRHKSVDTLRGYVREAELFQDHAGTGLL